MKQIDKVLLLGSSGMLGGAVYSYLTAKNINVIPLTRQTFDANQDIIYNKNFSVCPITTHLTLKMVTKRITKDLIYEKVYSGDLYFLS